jgi:hypothetical protein
MVMLIGEKMVGLQIAVTNWLATVSVDDERRNI